MPAPSFEPNRVAFIARRYIVNTLAFCLIYLTGAEFAPAHIYQSPAQQPGDTASDTESADVADFIDPLLGCQAIDRFFSGYILVHHRGRIIYQRGFGSASGNPDESIEANHLFEIGSLTKPFTAVAAMKLVQQGKLELDAPVSDYLPGVPEDCRKITVRHLLQHTSGMPVDNYGITDRGLETAVQTMLSGGPQNEPGSRFAYWNQGYCLLSQIIARAAGESYTATLRSTILEPAGMEGACFTGDALPERYVETTGQGNIGPPRRCLEHPYGVYGINYQGTGGLVCSPGDLAKFHIALRENFLLDETRTSTMFDAGEFPYALGWQIGQAPNGSLRQSHGGSVRGFVSWFARYPEDDSCIVVLSNNDTMPVQFVGEMIESLLFGPAVFQNFDSERASRLAGRYSAEVKTESGVTTYRINIREEDDVLLFEWFTTYTVPSANGLLLPDGQDGVYVQVANPAQKEFLGDVHFPPVESETDWIRIGEHRYLRD